MSWEKQETKVTAQELASALMGALIEASYIYHGAQETYTIATPPFPSSDSTQLMMV